MNDYAMDYEHLIRRAHQCERYGVTGANADSYKRLERSSNIYFADKTEKNLSAYMAHAGEVSSYIKIALESVRKRFDKELTDEQYNELEAIQNHINFSNIDKINEAIARANKVMKDINLFPK